MLLSARKLSVRIDPKMESRTTPARRQASNNPGWRVRPITGCVIVEGIRAPCDHPMRRDGEEE